MNSFPPERIAWTDSFADADGNIVPPSHYGMGDAFPAETLVTVTLLEQAGKTLMTMTHVGLPADETRDLTRQGWSESFDKLAASLENKKEQA